MKNLRENDAMILAKSFGFPTELTKKLADAILYTIDVAASECADLMQPFDGMMPPTPFLDAGERWRAVQ